jgi:hypothetical protein
MVKKLLQIFSVSCSHRHTSQPFSAAPRTRSRNDNWDAVPSAAGSQEWNHYIVCFDCGKKMPYDWEMMRVVK